MLARAADACRRLHAGPRFTGDFDMFARQAAYLGTVKERGFALPPTYDDHADAWADVRRALAVDPRPTVPCNNDLLAANFIDDGDRVWLIDYEYSGNNDACFELGNTSTECDFTPEQTEAYAEAYFGTPDASPTWPGCGSRRCAASTAGRSGGSSRPPPARSTSTSTAGAWSASRRPRRPSAARSFDRLLAEVARWLSSPPAPRSSSSAAESSAARSPTT